MIARPNKLIVRGQICKGAIIDITEVLMAYRKRGIATTMLEKMLTSLAMKNFDVVLAFLIAGRGGINTLKRAGFQKVYKYGHAGKALDKDKMDSLMDLNPILRKIALAIVDSKIGDTKPKKGIIREANYTDLDQIVDLLNSESARLDLADSWTRELLKGKMDWRYKTFVWTEQEVIRGSIISYEEIGTLGKDYFTSGFLKEMVFREDVDQEEKKILLNYALNSLKIKGIPSVSYPSPKNVMPTLKEAGFHVLPGAERTIFVKPLNNDTEKMLEAIDKFRSVNVFLIC
jgi:hypothetical protein